tara:strand:+ start:243 stop:569 length:327 start_codon:yes stop_codon:yes gene_type:complete
LLPAKQSGSELPTATALRLKKVLNVPAGTLPVLFLRAPGICDHLLRFDTKIREFFGLIISSIMGFVSKSLFWTSIQNTIEFFEIGHHETMENVVSLLQIRYHFRELQY